MIKDCGKGFEKNSSLRNPGESIMIHSVKDGIAYDGKDDSGDRNYVVIVIIILRVSILQNKKCKYL